MIYEFIKIDDSNTKKKDLKLVKPKELLNLKLYFVSANKNFTKLKPRVPQNNLTELDIENNNIPRICFAPSIQQCIQAIYTEKGKEYYVYVPKGNLFKHKIYKCTAKEVPDSNLTDEYWCLDEIEIQPLFKIKIGNDVATRTFKYQDITNYKVLEAYQIDNSNTLKEFADYKGVKYKKAEQNDISMWLEFKDYKEARKFFTMCRNELSELGIIWVDEKVYFDPIYNA